MTKNLEITQRIEALGLTLPQVKPPLGNYVQGVSAGNLLFLSSKLSTLKGKVGGKGKEKGDADVSVEEAYAAAKEVGLQVIATIQAELGSFDRLKKIVRINGLIHSSADFIEHPKVLNGCSDVLVEVLGELGKHTRSVIPVMTMPGGFTIKVDAIVEIAP